MRRILLGLLVSALPLSPASRAAAAPAAAPAGEAQNGKGAEAAPPPAPAPGAIDLAKLRADYDRLRDELYRARARAELRSAEMRLDGNSIWDSGEKPLVDERISVAERPIKPGMHSLTVRLEVRPGKKS